MVDFEFERPEGMSDQEWQVLAQKALKLLRQYTPVRTGKLRDGWTLASLTPDQLVITNPVEYAEYVNNGTPRMGARNMTGLTLDALK